ncbi:MAG: autotransporter-associated beta strand repeat-containing protein, partial [Akkermansia sp.]|nr:autotransporter-associated beta strand repeat-containing protein [Akkermansia sp.]
MIITGTLSATANTPIEFRFLNGVANPISEDEDIFVCGSVNEAQLDYLKPYITMGNVYSSSTVAYDGHFVAERGVDGLMHIHLVSGGGSGPTPSQGTIWNSPVYELSGNTITVTGNITYPVRESIVHEDEYGYWTEDGNHITCTAVGNVTVTGNGVISGSVPWDDDGGLSLGFYDEATSILLDKGVTFRNVQIERGYDGFNSSKVTLQGTYYACDIAFGWDSVDLTQAKLLAYNGNACKIRMDDGGVLKVSDLVVSPNSTCLEPYLGVREGATIQGNLKLQGALPKYTTSGVLTSRGCGINFLMSYFRYEDSHLCPMVIMGALSATADTPIEFTTWNSIDSLPLPEDDVFVCDSVDVSQLYHLKPYISTDYYGDDGYTLQPYNGHFEAERGVDGLMHIHLVSGGDPAREICFTRGGTWMLGGNGYADGNRVRFTSSGTVTVSGTVNPGAMTVEGSGSTTWNGSGSVAGDAALVKTGSGKLTINTDNSFSGGTGITQGTLRAGNKAALGTGTVQLSGGTLEIAARGIANTITASGNSAITVASGTTHELTSAISNTGTLTLKGAFDTSALKLTQDGVTHMDVNRETGDSGFTKTGGASVTIVTGGTTKNGGTTITHKGLAAGETLVLGSNGKAVSDGTVDYSTYLLTGTASAGMEDITKMAGKKLQLIDLQGGTLDIAAAKGATLAKGVTLNMDSGKVDGLLIVGNGSTLIYGGGSFTVAPELKGGTLDLGAASSITITGSKAAVTLGELEVSVTSKGTILTDSDLDVKGGTVTLTALNGYSGKFLVEGGTLKISTGKATVANEIEVAGEAVLNNGSTHSGDITVNGDLLKGSTVKLIDKNQRVTLKGGAVAGTISGIGRVDVNGSVDITQGKLTAEQVYLNGTLTHAKGWTLTKNQTLTLGGGRMAGNLIVGTGSVLVFNSHTLAE